MKQEVILVLDCGATNVRAIAVNRQGKIVARASTPNASDIAMENNTWHQWSLDAILQRFADCCRQINSELTECHIRGIAVTTFGVDGALVDKAICSIRLLAGNVREQQRLWTILNG